MTDLRSNVTSGRIVGIGATCDLEVSNLNTDRRQGFSVSEWVTLHDGRRVFLHHDRGFTTGLRTTGAQDPGPLYRAESVESLTETVLNVVLPDDDDDPEDHPWEWLADLARARGLDVTADDLRGLSYEVEFTEDIHRWLAGEWRGGWGAAYS